MGIFGILYIEKEYINAVKFYFFGGDFFILETLYDKKFDGALFLYNADANEFFTTISYNHQRIRPDFKYMVAVRPYAISPQYLAMIHRNIYHLVGDILQINLVSGWPKPEEACYNSFVGDVRDSSSSIEKSKYLIEYLNSIKELKNNVKNIKKNKTEEQLIKEIIPDIYVSATNKFVFDAAVKYGNKVIIPYSSYVERSFDTYRSEKSEMLQFENKRISLSLCPVIRDTEEEVASVRPLPRERDAIFCTPDQLVEKLKELKNAGIESVFLFSRDGERERLFQFMSKYKDLI